MSEDGGTAAAARAASSNDAIVSLLPAATDILAALGAWDRVVAVTHECDVPAGAAPPRRVTASRVAAGGPAAEVDRQVRDTLASGETLFSLDEATIRALRPGLIVTQGLCEVCAIAEGDVRRLATSMTPPARVLSLGARTLDDVLTSIVMLAREVGLGDEGEELVMGLRARMRRVHETLKAARAPRPRVAVVEWTEPVFVAGHWVPDMVRRAGGIDVLATPGEHSTPRPLASIRDAEPDLIVFAPCGYPLDRGCEEARATLARDEWAWARSKRVVVMDGNAHTSRPGPHLVDGIEIMARLFNPTCFPPLATGRGAVLVP
ncbi:MAG TPA: ABC transporter substrate-binding protein [Gemmatimonadaceae bacterium]|nr:ABC transporter substrate-binding protein [Gemmatimonadaceae bacterium]